MSNWEKFKAKGKPSNASRNNKFPKKTHTHKRNGKRSRESRQQQQQQQQQLLSYNQATRPPPRKKKKKKKKNKLQRSNQHSSVPPQRVLTRTLTKPPPPFRVAVSDSMKYLVPSDPQFRQLNSQCYRGLVFDPPAAVPDELHDNVADALETMRRAELFHRDVVATGRSVSATFVERTLIGNPGMTYFYQRLRIFAHSWDDTHCSPSSPLRVVRQLNDHMKVLTKRHAAKDRTQVKGSSDFNITLINYMQSQEIANESSVPLREEDKFGLGEASVSWHADSSLQDFSSIAVYHQTGSSDGTSWSVASRVIGDDVTPAIKVALKDRQTYYMLNDFNHHHHHSVLAGNTWRYSSTHRVAVTSKDTFDFAWKTCQEGNEAYSNILESIQKTSKNGIDPVAMRKGAEAHLVIEFDWLRMYVIQGKKHADSHSAYWQPAMDQLWEAWAEYEKALPIITDYLIHSGNAANPRSKRMFVWLLDELVEKRREMKKRCRSPAYFALPEDERPMPLPPAGAPFNVGEAATVLKGK
jgi:mRNA N6-methyladenine demethylase